MLKYVESKVVFEELPNEITLAINISNCPCHCKGCHSKYLWDDCGKELTEEELTKMAEYNKGITAICIMGGDSDAKSVNEAASFIKNSLKLNIGWYSGRSKISNYIDIDNFNYIKIGPYIEKLGPLPNPSTNQRLYKCDGKKLSDITSVFWKKKK